MENLKWKMFFISCDRILRQTSKTNKNSWCSWTTFTRLKEDAGYWSAELPSYKSIYEEYIGDGREWVQPFMYSDIAHILIPSQFYLESISGDGFECGTRYQCIDILSEELARQEIHHRKTDLVVEIKLY